MPRPLPTPALSTPPRRRAAGQGLSALALAAALLGLGGLPAARAADAAPKAQGLPPADAPAFNEKLASAEQLRALRAGGFSLYLRHGPTDNARADRVPAVDLNDCSTQRPLTEAGRKLMAQVGEAMRKARIPVSEFRVSPMCRARDSAAAAFPGLPVQVDRDLMYVANFTDEQKAPIIANTRALLSQAVPAHTNRLTLAHAPNLMDLIGYFPKEGTLVIFRPQGQGFEYVASIPPNHWSALLP